MLLKRENKLLMKNLHGIQLQILVSKEINRRSRCYHLLENNFLLEDKTITLCIILTGPKHRQMLTSHHTRTFRRQEKWWSKVKSHFLQKRKKDSNLQLVLWLTIQKQKLCLSQWLDKLLKSLVMSTSQRNHLISPTFIIIISKRQKRLRPMQIW